MSHETVMLEIPNVFEEGEEASIATLSQKFNIAAERFNQYPPVPLYRKAHDENRAVRRGERPDSYILVVDVKTAEDIARQLPPGKATSWSNSPVGPA